MESNQFVRIDKPRMERLDILLEKYRENRKQKRPLNIFYEQCAVVNAILGGNSPKQWMRLVKKYRWEIDRSIIDYTEICHLYDIENKEKLFWGLLKKHKGIVV